MARTRQGGQAAETAHLQGEGLQRGLLRRVEPSESLQPGGKEGGGSGAHGWP